MKLFPAKISERGNNAKKSRRQRVTISSYTTRHLKTGPSGNSKFCFPGDQSLSVYHCCDRCWLRHKTSTDKLVDCYRGSGIHQSLGRGMWDFFSLSVGNGKSWRLKCAFLRQMRFNKASVQLCPINWANNVQWSGEWVSNWNIQEVNRRAERTEEPLFQPDDKKGRVAQ